MSHRLAARGGRQGILWVYFADHSDYEGRIIHGPLKWCLAKRLEGRAAASAMLQASWQGGELFNDREHVSERTRVEKEGLLSAEEIMEVLRRAVSAKAADATAHGRRDPHTTSATASSRIKAR